MVIITLQSKGKKGKRKLPLKSVIANLEKPYTKYAVIDFEQRTIEPTDSLGMILSPAEVAKVRDWAGEKPESLQDVVTSNE